MSPKPKSDILVVEDEAQLRRLLRSSLEEAGYTVREAENGRIALGEIALQAPDLVILDLGLPDTSGTNVLRAMRPLCSVPVLILSVLGHEDKKIEALDAGADDYLTKPFNGGELLARLRALLRRVKPATAVERVFRFGPIQIELASGQVLRDGRTVKLTATEYRLLRLLVLNHDRVLTHSHILRELWGPHATRNVNYLRIYMMRLRRKLGEDVDSPGYFQTESGVGYRFVSEPSPALN
jgi:two-component system KDP operon response regulator KdpE